jgi:dihydrofolate reductase
VSDESAISRRLESKQIERVMPKLRVHNIGVSLDGYAAGPDQGRENPLGVGGEQLHDWMFETRTGREMIGEPGGDTGVADDFMRAGFDGIGATVMGRNMFGPIRGPWGDEEWKGWWGDEPVYHHPVFVLTHHPHEPIPMQGGTTFFFVDDGIESALMQAFDAANGADVRLGGGANAIQQYLRAGLIDEMHIAIVPVVLGRGERLFENVEDIAERYECTEFTSSPGVAHVRLVRSA